VAVFGLAVLGIVLGAAGMQFLRSSKPELMEKVENDIKHFAKSIRLSKSDDKKAKAK